MEFVVVMQVFQTHEQLADDDDNVFFRNAAWSHKVAAAAARTVLHNDPQI